MNLKKLEQNQDKLISSAVVSGLLLVCFSFSLAISIFIWLLKLLKVL